MELLDSLHESIKKSSESAVGLNRNRTRICLGVTGAETCRQEGVFFPPGRRWQRGGWLHIRNPGEHGRSRRCSSRSGNSIQVVTGQTGAGVNVGAVQRAVRWNGNV